MPLPSPKWRRRRNLHLRRSLPPNRPIADDSDLADAVKALARAHHNLIWARQRQASQLRSTLREFYPGALHTFDESVTESIRSLPDIS